MPKFILATIVLSSVISAVEAACIVTDPTGTPLNIRATPNGDIVGTLRNGDVVTIRGTAYDSRGRLWANIRIGWVYREFITCN